MEKEEEVLHELFDVGLLLRGIHAALEIITGLFAMFISPHFILRIVTKITQGELVEDPRDHFTEWLINLAHSFGGGTKQFVAFYLLSHGIINIVLVLGLFKKKMWAYHISFVVLTVFAI